MEMVDFCGNCSRNFIRSETSLFARLDSFDDLRSLANERVEIQDKKYCVPNNRFYGSVVDRGPDFVEPGCVDGSLDGCGAI